MSKTPLLSFPSMSQNSLPPIESLALSNQQETLESHHNLIPRKSISDPQEKPSDAQETLKEKVEKEDDIKKVSSEEMDTYEYKNWKSANDYYSPVATVKIISFIEKNYKKKDSRVPPPPLLHEKPEHYFERIKDTLNRKMLTDVIGREETFWYLFRDTVLSRLNLNGLPIDHALRLLAMITAFPSESQHVDRLIESLARRYHIANPDVFANYNQPFHLAFATLLLNTELHNPNARKTPIKPKRRNTLWDILSYLSQEALQGITEEIVDSIYESIKHQEIVGIDHNEKLFGRRLELMNENLPVEVKKPFKPFSPFAQQQDPDFILFLHYYHNCLSLLQDPFMDYRILESGKIFPSPNEIFKKDLKGKWSKYLEMAGMQYDKRFVNFFGGLSHLLKKSKNNQVQSSISVPEWAVQYLDMTSEKRGMDILKPDELLDLQPSIKKKQQAWKRNSDDQFRAPVYGHPIQTGNFLPDFHIETSNLNYIFKKESKSGLSSSFSLFLLFLYAFNKFPIIEEGFDSSNKNIRVAQLITKSGNFFSDWAQETSNMEGSTVVELLKKFSDIEKNQVIYHGLLCRKKRFETSEYKKASDNSWKSFWGCLVYDPKANNSSKRGFYLKLYSKKNMEKIESWLNDLYQLYSNGEVMTILPSIYSGMPKAQIQSLFAKLPEMPTASQYSHIFDTVAYVDKTFTKYPNVFDFCSTSSVPGEESVDLQIQFKTEDNEGLLRFAPLPEEPLKMKPNLNKKEFQGTYLQGLHFHSLYQLEDDPPTALLDSDMKQWIQLFNLTASLNTLFLELFSQQEKSWRDVCTEVQEMTLEVLEEQQIEARERKAERALHMERYGPESIHYSLSLKQDDLLLAQDFNKLFQKSWVEIEDFCLEIGISPVFCRLLHTMSSIDKFILLTQKPEDTFKHVYFNLLISIQMIQWRYLQNKKKCLKLIETYTRKLNQLEMTLMSSQNINHAKTSSTHQRGLSFNHQRIQACTVVADPGASERRGRVASLNQAKIKTLLKFGKEAKRPSLDDVFNKEPEELEYDASDSFSIKSVTVSMFTPFKLDNFKNKILDLKYPLEKKLKAEIQEFEKKLDATRVQHEKYKIYSNIYSYLILGIENILK